MFREKRKKKGREEKRENVEKRRKERKQKEEVISSLSLGKSHGRGSFITVKIMLSGLVSCTFEPKEVN